MYQGSRGNAQICWPCQRFRFCHVEYQRFSLVLIRHNGKGQEGPRVLPRTEPATLSGL